VRPGPADAGPESHPADLRSQDTFPQCPRVTGLLLRVPLVTHRPTFVGFSSEQGPRNGVNTGEKLVTGGVDQKVDQSAILALAATPPKTKKARYCRLFRWSECTDLNRGPLVPQTSALTRLSYTPTMGGYYHRWLAACKLRGLERPSFRSPEWRDGSRAQHDGQVAQHADGHDRAPGVLGNAKVLADGGSHDQCCESAEEPGGPGDEASRGGRVSAHVHAPAHNETNPRHRPKTSQAFLETDAPFQFVF
jgi:hypothetical protein